MITRVNSETMLKLPSRLIFMLCRFSAELCKTSTGTLRLNRNLVFIWRRLSGVHARNNPPSSSRCSSSPSVVPMLPKRPGARACTLSPLKVSWCEMIRVRSACSFRGCTLIVLSPPPLYNPLEAAPQIVQEAFVTGFIAHGVVLLMLFLSDNDVTVCAKSTLTFLLELWVICTF